MCLDLVGQSDDLFYLHRAYAAPKVVFHSPYLPDWLRWESNVLTGTPGIDAENCEITAIANYYHGDTGMCRYCVRCRNYTHGTSAAFILFRRGV